MHCELAAWKRVVAETTKRIAQILRKTTSKGMFGRYHVDRNTLKVAYCEYKFLLYQHVFVLRKPIAQSAKLK